MKAKIKSRVIVQPTADARVPRLKAQFIFDKLDKYQPAMSETNEHWPYFYQFLTRK